MNAPIESQPAPARRVGWLALLFLFAVFAAGVAYFSKQLPDRVATHFGAQGNPNGWMLRAQYTKFTLGIGIGTPLFIVGTFTLIERLKGWGLNIPNKAYWLDPERQRATYAFLTRQGFWLAALLVVFHAAIFYEIVLANARVPIVLPTAEVLGVTGGFLVALGIWATAMILRFRLPAK
jgi:uncharacterized membrane protein